MATLSEKIKTIVSEYTEQGLEHLSGQESLTDIGIDSLALVEIIFDIEEAFDITIPNEAELANGEFELNNIDDLVKVVNSLVDDKE